MTDLLYLTADEVGASTGGGTVTDHEVRALRALGGNVHVWSSPKATRPWGADEEASARLLADESFRPRIAHAYAGTFTKTIQILKERGCRVTYTSAAHDVQISRVEHEKLSLPFDYPHLTDSALWDRYVDGYRRADVVVCPSSRSAAIMRSYGCKNVTVIPHGVDPSKRLLAPLPERFAVAYLGQPGPDKGLTYLLEAWKILDYQGVLLTIAGWGTDAILPYVRQCGGGEIYLRGPVEDVDDVYDAIALYIQPSANEGFGIEVLEAMTRGRVVLCTDGAGASDILASRPAQIVQSRDALHLARAIRALRAEFESDRAAFERRAKTGVALAAQYDWSIIREYYLSLWETL